MRAVNNSGASDVEPVSASVTVCGRNVNGEQDMFDDGGSEARPRHALTYT